MLKGQKGITLVALVVTIIVLIILAGVSIALIMDENGIAKKAKDGATNYQVAANEDAAYIANAEAWVTTQTTPAE